MFWRHRAWTSTAAMSPCRAIVTAWTCITAAMILPVRVGSPAPCRGPVQGHGFGLRGADPAQVMRAAPDTFRERVAEIVRKVVPEKVSNMFDGLRPSAEAVPGPDGARRPEREAPERKVANDPEAALRKARTNALVRHARAVDAIFDMQERSGKASPEQLKELQEARKVFEQGRPYGPHDAEAAYKKNPELVREAAGGQVNRAIRALQLETEIRTDPDRRADRFVERWQKLSTRPASVSIRRGHVGLQIHADRDGRHGQEPATRSAA